MIFSEYIEHLDLLVDTDPIELRNQAIMLAHECVSYLRTLQPDLDHKNMNIWGL